MGGHEGEEEVVDPALGSRSVVQDRQEHAEELPIHKAWDRAGDQIIAFLFGELAQEPGDEVRADLVPRVRRIYGGRDRVTFKVTREQPRPPPPCRQYSLRRQGKKKGISIC